MAVVRRADPVSPVEAVENARLIRGRNPLACIGDLDRDARREIGRRDRNRAVSWRMRDGVGDEIADCVLKKGPVDVGLDVGRAADLEGQAGLVEAGLEVAADDLELARDVNLLAYDRDPVRVRLGPETARS